MRERERERERDEVGGLEQIQRKGASGALERMELDLASISVLAFVSVTVSAIWSRSRKRAGGGLERMELDLGLNPCLDLHLGQNGARSWPPPSSLMIAKSLFLFIFWSTMLVVGLVTLLAWVCWLIDGFGDWFGDWSVGLQQNVFLVTKKFVTKSPVFRH